MKYAKVVLCVLAVAVLLTASCATTPRASLLGDASRLDAWTKTHLSKSSSELPFSFVSGGKASSALLASWPRRCEEKTLDKARFQRTIIWNDPKTGLEVRCEAVIYRDYPAVEWTVYFENKGSQRTPIIQDIQGLDIRFEGVTGEEFELNGIKGDWCVAESFEPYKCTFAANDVKRFRPASSGKSCDGRKGWPYFNLRVPGGGVLMAVGWPGQWAASFARDAKNGLRACAGQELTHLYLKPGEKIRTPLIALLFWHGSDVVESQNLWRRWYMAHNIPRVDGRPQPALAQIQVNGAEQDIDYVKRFLEAGIKPDICWRDAGAGGTTWYPSADGPHKGKDAWLNTGTWDIDASVFPHGFKPFSDWVHANGMKFVLWFEPERAGSPELWLGKNHPEWLLQGSSHGGILNEGDPAAWQWLVDHVDGMIKSQGIDWYREDMNGPGPCRAWRKSDAADRQGITENLYVQGHLAFWDELKRRNPGLCIDSCASGGRRNDLESMRRAVPLLRSDFQMPEMPGVAEGNQGHTYGLSFWLPFQGSGVYSYDPYSYRSFYLSSFGMGGLTPENTAAQQKAYSECREVAPLMFGDYYPLTPYSLALDQWIAWQFNRPDIGDGVVQAFRRGSCEEGSKTFCLRGLDPDATYAIRDFDVPGTRNVSGRELAEKGLTVAIAGKPGAGVIVYKKMGR